MYVSMTSSLSGVGKHVSTLVFERYQVRACHQILELSSLQKFTGNYILVGSGVICTSLLSASADRLNPSAHVLPLH